MKELKKIKYWLFDLDNTLYSGDTKVFDQVDKKMSFFISEKLNISVEEAKKIQKNYFHEYNTTLNGMIKNHQIDAEEFLEFVDGSTLVIHNAQFDVGFLDNELKLASSTFPKLEEICTIEDSLQMARDMFPGQRNTLDALVTRFDIKGYDRELHGGLKDANILADVYLHLTGGQKKFEFISSNDMKSINNESKDGSFSSNEFDLKKIVADNNEMIEHEKMLSDMHERTSIEPLWRKNQRRR